MASLQIPPINVHTKNKRFINLSKLLPSKSHDPSIPGEQKKRKRKRKRERESAWLCWCLGSSRQHIPQFYRALLRYNTALVHLWTRAPIPPVTHQKVCFLILWEWSYFRSSYDCVCRSVSMPWTPRIYLMHARLWMSIAGNTDKEDMQVVSSDQLMLLLLFALPPPRRKDKYSTTLMIARLLHIRPINKMKIISQVIYLA